MLPSQAPPGYGPSRSAAGPPPCTILFAKTVLVAEDNFTNEQWAALRRVVKELLAKYPAIDTVLGHRDLDPGKACPSFSVRDWLVREQIREITWA